MGKSTWVCCLHCFDCLIVSTERPNYQAQSPDEAALVGAAANFGIVFTVSAV